MANLIGSGINQIPTNGLLGNLAFQDKAYVNIDKIGIGAIFVDSGTTDQLLQVYGGGAYISGNVGIGTTNPGAKLQVQGNILSIGTVTARPTVDQDGLVISGRAGGIGAFTATITPTTLTASRTITVPDATTTMVGTDATQTLSNKTYLIPYTEGAGTALTATAETTNQVLFPAAGDTITLGLGVYEINMVLRVTRGATSTTSSALRVNLLGTGGLSGTFTGTATSSIADGGATSTFHFNGVNVNTNITVTTASTTAGGIYIVQMTGILKVTTAALIVPAYGLTVALTGATSTTTCSATNYMRLIPISASGTTTAQGGWG